jgi:serine acetyltransferase
VGRGCRVFGTLLHRSLPPWTDWNETVEPAPRVADGVFIGMGAQLIGDIEIGQGSYVAAGAIVTRSVPAAMLVKGANDVTPLPDP